MKVARCIWTTLGIASEEVILHLTTSKCITLHVSKALPQNESQLSSQKFMVNRFIMKPFTSSDMQTTEFCRLQFNFKLPSKQTVGAEVPPNNFLSRCRIGERLSELVVS